MKSWEDLRAEDVMSAPVVTVGVDTTVEEAARILSEQEMSGALVSDHRGAPVGVVSLYDLVSYLAGLKLPREEPGGFYRHSYPDFGETGEGWQATVEELPEEPLNELLVEEIMTGGIIAVPPTLPLRDVAKLMAERHIHRVFVSGKEGPVGVISTMDVLGALSGVRRSKVRA
jgi:CBS domain-containing protein